MRIALLLGLLSIASGTLHAQANAVAGLNGRLDVVDNLTYWGRRGSPYPNGEVGMSMRNTMCNPGTVNIPWFQAMQPNHPKFGFLIARESAGRMVQISDYSFCKHAFTSTNGSGTCGTCVDPGTGALMGIRCSDTYGANHNADPDWLGPATELDPWLGSWNPVGSYFDVGDPQTGTGPADGVRSLVTAGFDAVKNRVIVKESDLSVAGARYFYGIHLMHEGEPVANRGDNLASRGFNSIWNGSGWTFTNNAVAQAHGSILQHWQGATLDIAGNGTDDGRFAVAVVVTSIGGGSWHYEYAVHNIDNHRGGAAFRVPVDTAGVVSNIGFRDIDADPLNNWTGARAGNEIVWQATANNPQNWNSLFNFWFDCTVAPLNGLIAIDEARIGPGALSIQVGARVPSSIPTAVITSFGQGCGGCAAAFYEGPSAFDLANNSMTLTLTGGYYVVSQGTGSYVAPTGVNLGLGDDDEATVSLPFTLPYQGGSTSMLRVCSNGFISPAIGNGTTYSPSLGEFFGLLPRWAANWCDLNPNVGGQVISEVSQSVARITWLNVPDYGAVGSSNTFQCQFYPNGTVHILWRAMTAAGSNHLVGFSPGGGVADPGSSDLSARLPAGFSLCAAARPPLALAAAPRPVLGATVQFTINNIPPGSPFGAVLLSLIEAVPPTNLAAIGMPGCLGYTSGGVTFLFLPSASSAMVPFTINSNPIYVGAPLVAQAATYSPPVTPLGAISSNGVRLLVGIQ